MLNQYSLRTIRNKGLRVGYKIHKGFMHYMYNGAVVRDCTGMAYTGYVVEDLTTGFLVWGCYNQNFDYLWTLEDVEEFLKNVYEENGRVY